MTDQPTALPLPLDLHDPETANEVADAIRRYHAPTRTFVPLSDRYPWLHDREERELTAVGVADAVVETLQTAGLVFTVPPGRCGAPYPDDIDQHGNLVSLGLSCSSRAGHAGQHESTYWPPVVGLEQGISIAWDDVADVDVPKEIEIHGSTFVPDELPDALALALNVQDSQTAEIRRLTARLQRLSALISEGEDHSHPVTRTYAGRLRAALLADDPEPISD